MSQPSSSARQAVVKPSSILGQPANLTDGEATLVSRLLAPPNTLLRRQSPPVGS